VLITVVTPTLNAERYLHARIESTRGQVTSNVQVEHVVVDGGSTDGTVEFARSRSCTVMTGRDEGIFDAINKGSFNSSGALVGFLGADDVLLPGALDAVARHYRRAGRRWLVGGGRWLDGDGAPRGDVAAPPSWMTVPMLASLGWNCIPHTATYMRRDLFEELGGFDKQFKYSGDYDFMLRALQREPFARINRTLSAIRRHGGNASMQETPVHRAEAEEITRRYGPSSRSRRVTYQYLLKLWLNGTNPGWFLRKRADDLRGRLSPSTPR
jgi:glycosyltransferase involved in cell wall biosynthesis